MLSSILAPVDALPSSFAIYAIYPSGTPIAEPDAKCIWRIVGSGITKNPRLSKNVNIIVGVAESGWSGSPANAAAYMISARFRDGGLAGVTGNYFYSARGVFVWGPLVVRYIAEKLNVRISPRHEALLQRYSPPPGATFG